MKLKRVEKPEDLTNSLLLANHAQEGDICLVTSTKELFKFQDNKWVPYIPEFSGEGPKISLYELNRSIMREQPAYDAEQMKQFIEDFNQYADETANTYYMLLSIETSYYTVFVHNSERENDLRDLGSALLAVSIAIGPIIGHDITEDHVEIWFRDKRDNEAYIYMLFPYDGGVVQFG